MAMSTAAFALGLPCVARSIRSTIEPGLSNSTPERARAINCSAFVTEWTFSRVTSLGAAQPCPVRRPEWTATKMISAMSDEPRAIANGSFR